MTDFYRERFENIKRMTQKITSSLDIAAVLEEIRDETRVIFPRSKESCLLVFDKQAKDYMRPVHCGVHETRVSCLLCKKARKAFQEAIYRKCWVERDDQRGSRNSPGIVHEVAFPIFEDEKIPAALSIMTDRATYFDKRDIALLQDLSDGCGGGWNLKVQ